MPLQIRRGPTADRLAITPLVGELVYDTTTQAVYIGDGTTAGGLPVTTFSIADSRSTTAKMFLGDSLSDNSVHSGITFTLVGNRLQATVQQDLSNYIGLIKADQGFKGNLWADDSGIIINSETHQVYGTFIPQGDIIPDANEAYDLGSASRRFKDIYLSGSSIFLGNAVITSTGTAIDLPLGTTIAGQPVGLNEGDTYGITISGNVIATDSTVLVNTSTGSFHGDLYGSVFASDSSILVDARDGVLRGQLIGTVTGNVTGDVSGNASSATVATTVNLVATNTSAGIHYITLTANPVGNEEVRTDTGLTYQPSTNTLSASVLFGNTVTTTTLNSTTTNATTVNSTNLFASIIDSSDSSPITVTPETVFQSKLTVEEDLNVVGNILPVNSEESSLGSFTKKYSRLYLSEGANALWIGNVAMSVSGSTLDLPAGTTVGGSAIAVSAGGNAVTVTVNPSSTNAIFYLPFFDSLSGDRTVYVDSNLNYNPSTNTLSTDLFIGNVTGNVTGDVIGNLTGNTTGYHTGDVKGSVVGDDSTIIIDGVNNTINASYLEGIASRLSGITSSGPIIAQNDNNLATVLTSTQFFNNTTNAGGTANSRRARGTISSPAVVVTNDILHNIDSSGYDGSAYQTSTRILSRATGTVTGGRVPGQLEFYTADSTGTLQARVSITNAGIVNVFGNLTVNSGVVTTIQGAYSTIGPSFLQYHNTADSSNFTFTRYRGTTSAPLAVQTGDDIQDIAFVGYDGTSTQTLAGITVGVDGAVSTGSIPGKLVLSVASGSGALNGFAEAVVIGSDKVVDFKAAELTAGGASGQVDTSSVITYLQVKINGVTYGIPAYAIRP